MPKNIIMRSEILTSKEKHIADQLEKYFNTDAKTKLSPGDTLHVIGEVDAQLLNNLKLIVKKFNQDTGCQLTILFWEDNSFSYLKRRHEIFKRESISVQLVGFTESIKPDLSRSNFKAYVPPSSHNDALSRQKASNYSNKSPAHSIMPSPK